MKKKIHFIINSRSEKALTELSKQLDLDLFWQETHDCFLWKSLYKGHALELVQKAIQYNTSLVIACGGDGTINDDNSLGYVHYLAKECGLCTICFKINKYSRKVFNIVYKDF